MNQPDSLYEVITAEIAQKLLTRFKNTENVKLVIKTNVRYDGPDTQLHTYQAETGFIHILEIDFIQSMQGIGNLVKDMLGRKVEFHEVKKPFTNIEDTGPYRSAQLYKIPKDVDQIKKYAHLGGLESDIFFSFLIAGRDTEKVNLF